MLRPIYTFFLPLGASLVLAACGNSDAQSNEAAECPEGSEACPCYGNRTCDRGLECRSSLCVEGDDRDGGETAEARDGGATETDASSSDVCDDCTDSEVCIAGQCAAIPDECPCPAETYCDLADNRCVIGCSSDAHCDGARVCVEGECRSGCREDEDCASGATCEDGVCTAGEDPGECEPGERQCDELQRQRCSEQGTWQNEGAPCEAACEEGICTGSCVPGTTQCVSATQLQVCSDDAEWDAAGRCEFACVGDACGGECQPGESECVSGTESRECRNDGAWGTPSLCSFACMADGQCVGECQPGATRCADTATLQHCDEEGSWGTAVSCARGCVEGECISESPSGPSCDPSAPFTMVRALEGLGVADVADGAAALALNEQLIVFYSQRAETRVYSATRSAETGEFGEPAPIVEGDGEQWHPWVSEDGLTLLYSDGQAIYLSQRSNLDESFEQGRAILSPNANTPFVVGGANGTLYYVESSSATPGGPIVQVSLENWEPAGEPLVHLVGRRPTVSADELVLYYGPAEGYEIRMAARQSVDEPFADVGLVQELTSPNNQLPAWISPDGCRLYFDRAMTEAGTQWDMYLAERSP